MIRFESSGSLKRSELPISSPYKPQRYPSTAPLTQPSGDRACALVEEDEQPAMGQPTDRARHARHRGALTRPPLPLAARGGLVGSSSTIEAAAGGSGAPPIFRPGHPRLPAFSFPGAARGNGREREVQLQYQERPVYPPLQLDQHNRPLHPPQQYTQDYSVPFIPGYSLPYIPDYSVPFVPEYSVSYIQDYSGQYVQVSGSASSEYSTPSLTPATSLASFPDTSASSRQPSPTAATPATYIPATPASPTASDRGSPEPSIDSSPLPSFHACAEPHWTRMPAAVVDNSQVICEVWAANLEIEMRKIREVVNSYSYVAMDTEFPGVVVRPIGEFRSTIDYQYQLLRCNVDLLKIIQLGLSFMNEKGEYPAGINTWQFNFKFNLTEDMYSQDSIDLLANSGLQFQKHEEEGIDPLVFAELLMTSGVVLCEVKWLSFHSGYDFGYMVKLLTDSRLPEEEHEFFTILNLFFPTIYDVKYLMKSCKNLKGGLQEVADQLDLQRIGRQHQAGSDSLLTGMAFFRMKELFFEDHIDDAKYCGRLYGLGTGVAPKSNEEAEEKVSLMSLISNGQQ